MKILKDEIDRSNELNKIPHIAYDEFELSQFIVELDVGDKIEILVNGKKEKEFTAKYINCHMNARFQDKGIKNKVVKK